MKSREEVEQLKQNWRSDPCYDLEATKGFEEYRDELLEYSRKQCAEWDVTFRRDTLRTHVLEAARSGGPLFFLIEPGLYVNLAGATTVSLGGAGFLPLIKTADGQSFEVRNAERAAALAEVMEILSL